MVPTVYFVESCICSRGSGSQGSLDSGNGSIIGSNGGIQVGNSFIIVFDQILYILQVIAVNGVMASCKDIAAFNVGKSNAIRLVLIQSNGIFGRIIIGYGISSGCGIGHT